MARREDKKAKQPKLPKDPLLSLEQRKEKMRQDIRERFRQAFGHEDVAIIPIRRSK